MTNVVPPTTNDTDKNGSRQDDAAECGGNTSSRLVIKNLPPKITVDKLKNMCGELGLVTDCQLKYNSAGKFRNFAFVGFRTVDEAKAAKNYLHNSYIGSSKIQVEFCRILTDPSNNNGKSDRRKSNKSPDDKNQDNSVNINNTDDGHRLVTFENLPRNIKKKTLKNYIMPVKPIRIDILNETATPSCFSCSATVKVSKKSDVKMLEKLNGKFFGGQKITVTVSAPNNNDPSSSNSAPPAAAVQIANEIKSMKEQTDLICETGRLFVRNIPYVCTLEDVQKAFQLFGPIADIKLPLDSTTKQHKGYAMISFVLPENALKAFSEMDGTVFNGRMLHIVPGQESKEEKQKLDETNRIAESSSYKAKKNLKQTLTSSSSHNWNTLFLGANAVADVLAEKLGAEKSQLLNNSSLSSKKTTVGVRMALGETQLVKETRDFLLQNGVSLESFENLKQQQKNNSAKKTRRSSTVILVKNLPAKTSQQELKSLFEKFGQLGRLILPPSCITAIVEFMDEQEARKAFKALAYKKFKNSAPLFLEWAPEDVFSSTAKFSTRESGTSNKVQELMADNDGIAVESSAINQNATSSQASSSKEHVDSTAGISSSTSNSIEQQAILGDTEQADEDGTVIFVKNLNFQTTDEALRDHFSKIGPLKYATVAKKKNPAAGSNSSSTKNANLLSMGYGFVKFLRKSDAKQALKTLQRKTLDDFALELKMSDRKDAFLTHVVGGTSDENRMETRKRKTSTSSGNDQKSETKLLVKNVPFQANKKEIENLLGTFGELRSVRLPKKSAGGSGKQHRGFAFVDFTNKSDAQKAYDALKLSTHLYGRRIVLEWATENENLDDLRAKVADFAAASADSRANKRQKVMLENLQ